MILRDFNTVKVVAVKRNNTSLKPIAIFAEKQAAVGKAMRM